VIGNEGMNFCVEVVADPGVEAAVAVNDGGGTFALDFEGERV
jgi:hypothetical protein